jgi:hypothetical protein
MPSPFFRTALNSPPPSAAAKERFGLKRRRPRRPGIWAARFQEQHEEHEAHRRERTVTRIVWSAGDDGEHAWFWDAEDASGRTLASGYLHTQDEEAVVKTCEGMGAEIAEGAKWESE